MLKHFTNWRHIASIFIFSIIFTLLLIPASVVVADGYHPGMANRFGHVSKFGVENKVSIIVKEDGTAAFWGANNLQQTRIPSGANNSQIVDVAAGYVSTLVKNVDGTVMVWGMQTSQVANHFPSQSTLGQVISLSQGTNHALALRANGSVYQWGQTAQGQGSVPSAARSDVIAISGGGIHSLALKRNGQVIAWGSSIEGAANVPASAKSGVIAISGARTHSLALKSDGTVVGWGSYRVNNPDGIKVPAGLNDVIAVNAGRSQSLALKSDGSVVAWNNNGYVSSPSEVSSGVIAITAGYDHFFAYKADGTVFAWGDNSNGSATIPAHITNPVKIRQIASGGDHSMALKSNGEVIVWGKNSSGQTDVPTAALSDIKAIEGGLAHALALKSDGSVVAWGDNSHGETNVPSEATSGVVAISAGDTHSLALKSDGSVVAWGNDSHDQVSVPSEASAGIAVISAGGSHSMALKDDGILLAWGNNSDGQTDVPAELGDRAVAISAGTNHSLAVKTDGSVVAWGSNSDGQIDVPAEASSGVVAVSAGDSYSLALKWDGTVIAWGKNNKGQINVPPLAQSGVVAIKAGKSHVLALKADGSVVAWGSDEEGQSAIVESDIDSVVLMDQDGATLPYTFDASSTEHLIVIDQSVSEVRVQAALTSPNAGTAYVNGQAYDASPEGVSIPVPHAETKISLVVSPYLSQSKTYTITVKRAPQITMSPNGNEAWSDTASTQVDVQYIGDSLLEYVWSQDEATPAPDDAWQSFDNGFTVTKSEDEGDWYLHVRAESPTLGTFHAKSERFRLDQTPPTITISMQNADDSPYTNGKWTNQPVKVTAVANDTLSGVDTFERSLNGGESWEMYTPGDEIVVTSNGINTLLFRATDLVGNNIEQPQTVQISIDGLVMSTTLKHTDNTLYTSRNWAQQAVKASVDAMNSHGAPLSSLLYSLDEGATWQAYATELSFAVDGLHSLWVEAKDEAGNLVQEHYDIHIDQAQPMISISMQNTDGSPYTNESWTNQAVTVTAVASDTTSGIAVFELSLDGGQTWQAYTSSDEIVVTSDGVHHLQFRAIDHAGNTHSEARTINISQFGLQLTTTLKQADYTPYTSGTWTQQTVTASVYATNSHGAAVTSISYSLDEGATWQAYSTELTFTADGEHVLWVEAKDESGNTIIEKTSIRRDQTQPTIAVSMDKANSSPYTMGSWTNEAVTVKAVANDATSGIAVLEHSLDGGHTWQAYTSNDELVVSTDGVHHVLFRAIDHAGNTHNEVRTINISQFGLQLTTTLEQADQTPYTSGTWTKQTVTASVYATNSHGAAITTLMYSLDEGATWHAYSSGITFTADGQHVLWVDAKDEAGNETINKHDIFVDQTLPSVHFTPNGEATPSLHATVVVTVSDDMSGVDPTSLRYSWSQSELAPSVEADWIPFDNGDELMLGNVKGEWYLHVRAKDHAGNTITTHSQSYVLYKKQAKNEDDQTILQVQPAPIMINTDTILAGLHTLSLNDGRRMATVTLDAEQIEQRLKTEGMGSQLTVIDTTSADVLRLAINAHTLQIMKQWETVVTIQSEQASYTIPVSQLGIEHMAPHLGDLTDMTDLTDLTMVIDIALPTIEQRQFVERLASEAAYEIVASPHYFSIKAVVNHQEFEISTFTAYVERTIAIPDDVNASRVSTVVVIEHDGTVRHVPTKLDVREGKQVAVFNSLTNSLYAVVENPIVFTDIGQHWAKEAIMDLGTRMIVNGDHHRMYHPDHAITRAEFAAIIVRALGLKPMNDSPIKPMNGSPLVFTDINEKDWFRDVVHTAYAYDLINGFTDGAFRPHDRITREQAMAIISKAMALTDLKGTLTSFDANELLSQFDDGEAVSAWAIEHIATGLHAGIMTGKTQTTLAPQQHMTRAEVAVIIQRLLSRSELI